MRNSLILLDYSYFIWRLDTLLHGRRCCMDRLSALCVFFCCAICTNDEKGVNLSSPIVRFIAKCDRT